MKYNKTWILPKAFTVQILVSFWFLYSQSNHSTYPIQRIAENHSCHDHARHYLSPTCSGGFNQREKKLHTVSVPVAFTVQTLTSPDSSTPSRIPPLIGSKNCRKLLLPSSRYYPCPTCSSGFNQREKKITRSPVLTIRSPHHTYRSVFCHLRCVGTRDSTVEITNNSIGRQFLGGSPGVAPKSAGGLSLQTRHFLVPDRIMVTLKAVRRTAGAGHN